MIIVWCDKIYNINMNQCYRSREEGSLAQTGETKDFWKRMRLALKIE